MRANRLFPASMVVAALSAMSGRAQAQRIEMPVGYRLTWIGARWQANARVLDSRGQPTATTLTYRMADPSVATVSRTGEVTAKKPGNTRLWAVAGRDSASALIVVEQWPARFTFSPASIRFDARDVKQEVRVLASDSAGVPIVGGSIRAGVCRSVNTNVATLRADTVTAVANGSTWIRCADRGIADSIRVTVQQRATSAFIVNKPVLTRQRAPGDTFSVRVTARDRMGKDVADARPTWASLNPLVVSVDPVSGRARAVGGGEARVIVQVGDVADSVSIPVSGNPIQLATAPVAPVDSAPKARAMLRAQEMFIYEGETTYVSLTAVDTAGAAVPFADLAIRIADTSIVRKLDTARIVGRKAGQSQFIVRYAGLADTATINVRTRSSGSLTSGLGGDSARAAFAMPRAVDSTRQHAAALQAARNAIFTDPNVRAIRQDLDVVTNAFGSVAEQLIRTDDGVIEDRTGPLYGGTANLTLYQKLELAGSFRLGTLASVDTIGENVKFKEAEGSVGIFPIRQLGLRAGVQLRGEDTELASQTWMIPKVSLVSRFSFIGNVFNTYGAFFIMPKAKSSRAGDDVETGSLFSRGAEAGLEFRLARATGLNGGLTYYVEQLSFDESQRTESFAAIRLRFGFNFGR
jgi:hypothetical protein